MSVSRLRNLLVAATALITISRAMNSQSPLSGSVSGHVFTSDTNQPARFAIVTLQSGSLGSDGGANFSSTTDLDGAFLLNNVPPGIYSITTQMAGYLSGPRSSESALNAAATTSSKQIVSVQENQQTPIELRMERGGSLTGVVRYDDGSPALNLDVRLFQQQAGTWKPVGTSPGAGTSSGGLAPRTDDRGYFREAGLPSGTYAVEVSLPAINSSATPQFGRRIPSGRSSGQTLHVYSGNVFRIHDAKPIELRQGEERNGADVQIPLSGLHIVRGVIGAKSSGRRVGQGSVRLLDPDDKSLLREASIVDGGYFSFTYIPSGTYLIRIEGRPDRRDSQGVSYQILQQTLTIDGDLINLGFDLEDATQ